VNHVARIEALRRYVALLRGEERRLKMANFSTSPQAAQEHEQTDAELNVITRKLLSAERELTQLEIGGKRKEIF
jgi:hypothetical protein